MPLGRICPYVEPTRPQKGKAEYGRGEPKMGPMRRKGVATSDYVATRTSYHPKSENGYSNSARRKLATWGDTGSATRTVL
eukprot:scaffold372064_cov41-Prasinocladus_malaysianus.AAC.1